MKNETREENEKKVYEKPSIERVDLALDETLATGCKLGSDSACMGPPSQAYNEGS